MDKLGISVFLIGSFLQLIGIEGEQSIIENLLEQAPLAGVMIWMWMTQRKDNKNLFDKYDELIKKMLDK